MAATLFRRFNHDGEHTYSPYSMRNGLDRPHSPPSVSDSQGFEETKGFVRCAIGAKQRHSCVVCAGEKKRKTEGACKGAVFVHVQLHRRRQSEREQLRAGGGETGGRVPRVGKTQPRKLGVQTPRIVRKHLACRRFERGLKPHNALRVSLAGFMVTPMIVSCI